jgi:hypothetical protein
MRTKHARKIREGILLARSVARRERIGPYRKPYPAYTRDLTLYAYIRTMRKIIHGPYKVRGPGGVKLGYVRSADGNWMPDPDLIPLEKRWI